MRALTPRMEVYFYTKEKAILLPTYLKLFWRKTTIGMMHQMHSHEWELKALTLTREKTLAGISRLKAQSRRNVFVLANIKVVDARSILARMLVQSEKGVFHNALKEPHYLTFLCVRDCASICICISRNDSRNCFCIVSVSTVLSCLRPCRTVFASRS